MSFRDDINNHFLSLYFINKKTETHGDRIKFQYIQIFK